MAQVFLSHASEDVNRVSVLVDALREREIDLWWDGDLKPGDRYAEVIAQELGVAACVVICWSAASVASKRDWVKSEAERMRNAGGVVISVLFDVVDVPPPFNVFQAISMLTWNGNRTDKEFRSLVEGIRLAVTKNQRDSPVPFSNRSRRRALLIGVGGYTSNSQIPRLPATRGNVEELERTLKRQACGFNVTTIRDPQKQDVENALDAFFGNCLPDDLLFLYYTGHVLQDDAKGLHLTAVNTLRDRPRPSAIAFGRLSEDFLVPCTAGQIVLVIDAQFGNASAEDVQSALRTSMGPGRSLVLLASSAEEGDDAAWQGSQSPFNARLVSAIETDIADSNHDEIVTAEEVGNYLSHGEPNASTALYWPFLSAPSQIELRRRAGRTSEEIAPTSEQRSFVGMLASEFERGKIVPFLGDGIYGSGPLSFLRIARALADKAGLAAEKRQDMIATAGESLELRMEDRAEFLQGVHEVFSEQADTCVPPTLHELLVELKPPWLMITVNYDDLLRRRLRRANRHHVVVAHVLRSGSEGDPDRNCHAGKILVVRSSDHPDVMQDPSKEVELRSAEDSFLKEDDCVLYTLLGSPFLHDLPFVKEHKLDTMVITESDHVDFLVHLREASTGVPSAISARLRMQTVLFLEYNLDFWQYRLIGHLFRRPETNARPGSVVLRKTPYLLRTATSPTEELFWNRRFNPTRVPMDLTAFVRALRAARGGRR